jgi:hypothetical protein
VGKTQVNNHKAEVVGESVGNEEPFAAEVLKPDLRLALVVFALVNKRETTIFDFTVDVKCKNFTKRVKVLFG